MRDDLSAFVGLAQFQISFGQQVEVLRLVRMFLDLLRQLGQIQLRPVLRREIGTIIKIIEKMLIGIRTRRSIFGESLKDIQIPLCGVHLMEAPLDHGKFVVA